MSPFLYEYLQLTDEAKKYHNKSVLYRDAGMSMLACVYQDMAKDCYAASRALRPLYTYAKNRKG